MIVIPSPKLGEAELSVLASAFKVLTTCRASGFSGEALVWNQSLQKTAASN